MIASLICLVLQSDFLVLVFLLGFAGVSLVLGGFSTKSPYSHFGANRELLQILAYEPVLLLLAIAIYAQNGTFLISTILSRQEPLLLSLWPLFIAVLYVLTIKMRKSPFDISTSSPRTPGDSKGDYHRIFRSLFGSLSFGGMV